MPRRVTFYRLETGRTATVLVPDHGVLRKRTVQRLADALGYPGVGRPGLTSPQIADAVQLTERKPFGVEVVEPEVPPPDDLASGSVALRFRSATAADVERLESRCPPWPDSPAEYQAEKMINAFRKHESEK